MSVRATDRLIGDIVYVTKLQNSPEMVVHSIDAEAKMVNTTWFAADKSAQEAQFPASALDRVEIAEKAAKKPKAKAAKK